MAARNVRPNEEKVHSLRSDLQAVILSAVVTGNVHFLEEAIALSIEQRSVFCEYLTGSKKSFRLFDFFPEQTKIKVWKRKHIKVSCNIYIVLWYESQYVAASWIVTMLIDCLSC